MERLKCQTRRTHKIVIIAIKWAILSIYLAFAFGPPSSGGGASDDDANQFALLLFFVLIFYFLIVSILRRSEKAIFIATTIATGRTRRSH